MAGRQSISGRITLCFFLSGASGLIYQVTWVKALGMIFGHTAYAVATVLAVFMGGLAAGSACLTGWSNRKTDPLKLYARIEFLIGLTGALSLVGLHGLQSLYVAAYPALGKWQPLLLGMRLFGAATVLFIPTFFMGGTFPILVSGITQSYEELDLRVSQLYWINSAGAVFGTLIAGFALLPILGLRLTIGAAAALNGVAGLLALYIVNGTRAATAEPSIPTSQQSRFEPLFWLFGIVGGTALAYEIAWTRLLAITIGGSTYAFTLMLATFLTGIVIGSALFEKYVSSIRRISLAALSWVQIGIGMAALASLVLFHWIPAVIPPLLRATNRTFGGLVLAQFVTSALTVLPTALFFGFNFPMVIALINRKGNDIHSSAVGKAYAANTVGAIVGSVMTGFWLIPRLSTFRVVVAVAVVNLFLALAVVFASKRHSFMAVATALVLLLVALTVGSSSFFDNQSLLSLSAVLYGSAYQGRLTLSEIAATKDLVFTAEGVNDSISVVRTDGDVALRVNGKIDASTQDAPTQLLLGHLGSALHPSPKRVLVIGFGSGMTASAVARYPDVDEIDCVEIERAVLQAAPYLRALNRGVLNDPRVHVIFDDARNFLLTSRAKYDLIISEPSNPWIAGVATLFTNEYYAAAKRRLAPGGMFVQWVQAYSLAPGDLRMIIATFASHFPEVTLWRGGETDLLLLGRTNLSRFQFDRLRLLWQNAALRADFASLDIHKPEGLVAYFLLDDTAVRRLANGSRLNRDDRNLLEYHAPETLLASNSIDLDNIIGRFRSKPIPPNLRPSEVRPALAAGLATALDLNDTGSAKAFLNAIDPEPESVNYNTAKGRLAIMQGATANAKQFLQAALRLDPESPEAAYWLAIVEHQGGDDAAASARIKRILQSHPSFTPAIEEEMGLTADHQDFDASLAAQRRRLAFMPDPPAYELGRLGALLIKTGNLTQAEAVLLKGLAKDPYCYACHFELGELYLRSANLRMARSNFKWVVRFFPDANAAAFRSLAGIDVLLGDPQAARAVLNEGLRLFPDDAVLLKAQAGLGT